MALTSIIATLVIAHGAFAQDARLSGLDLVGVPVDLEGHEPAPRTRPTPPEETIQFSPDDADREWFGARPFLQWERLTGDWGGARTKLEQAGLTIDSSFLLDWSSAWSGGISGRATRRTLFDFAATLDLDAAFGWQGGTAFLNFYSTNKTGGSEQVGDFQGFSNIETDRTVDQIAELWLEQVLFDGALRFKVGKIDANSEFAFVESAGEFINSSAGFSPTILGIPSYPDPATGVVAQFFPTERAYISLGFFDGAAGVDGVPTGRRGPSTFFSDDLSDDYFLIAEVGMGWMAGDRPGRVSVGVWHHTGEFDTFDGGVQSGATGLYALTEQRLWSRDANDEDSDRGLYLFNQFGWTEDDVSEAELHAGVGISMLGTFHTRESDAAGVYLSWVRLNRDAGFNDDEVAIEAFYRLQITPSVSLKPNLQAIFNPGGDSAIDDAIIASLRVEIVF